MTKAKSHENEIWVPIKIPNNIKPNYMVSDHGQIKNIKSGKILKPYISKSSGYLYVSLPTYSINIETGQTVIMKFTVHSIVLSNFTTEYDKIDDPRYIVNHKDGDKLNNWLYNLEWVTYKGNAIHARENGLLRIGDECVNSKVDNDTVRQICELLETDASYQDIASKLHLPWNSYTQSLMIRIRKRIQWKEISKDYDFDSSSRLRIHSDELIHNICKSLELGMKTMEIRKLYGQHIPYRKFKALVYNIRTRQTYRDIGDKYKWQVQLYFGNVIQELGSTTIESIIVREILL